MNRTDEYFAGLFDGEGTVGIYAVNSGRKDKDSGSKTYWTTRLGIVGTHRPMIEACQSHFGFGSLATQKRQKKQMTPRGEIDPKLCRQGWRWSITNRAQISIFLERITPYLFEKKIQCEVVMRFIKGELDGEQASLLCKKEKQFSFPANLGENKKGYCQSVAPNRKLDWEKILEIRRLYHKEGLTAKELYVKYGVSDTTMYKILNRQTYIRPPLNYSNPA